MIFKTNYHLMQVNSNLQQSTILLTFLKLPFVIKIFVLIYLSGCLHRFYFIFSGNDVSIKCLKFLTSFNDLDSVVLPCPQNSATQVNSQLRPLSCSQVIFQHSNYNIFKIQQCILSTSRTQLPERLILIFIFFILALFLVCLS